VEEEFEVCWNCGTSREGVPDPDFQPAAPPAMDDDGSEDREDLTAEVPKARKSYHPLRRFFQSAWTPYVLAWLFAGFYGLSLFMYLYRNFGKIHLFNHMHYLSLAIKLLFVIACIAFVTHRKWGNHWLKASVIWIFTLSWPNVEFIIYQIYSGFPLIDSDFHYLSYLYPLSVFLDILFPVLLITTLYYQKASSAILPIEVKPEENRKVYLLYAGLLFLLMNLFFRWLETLVERQIYALTFASYLEITGVIAILLWHLLQKGYSLPATAISFSVIVWAFPYNKCSDSNMATILLWIPALVAGLVSVMKRNRMGKIAWVALFLPLLFLLIVLFPPNIPIYEFHFGTYDKPTSLRPDDFPAYIQVPSGASNVTYLGGERPYVSFTIEEPYTAPQTLAFLAGNLEATGWEKLPYDALNPESPSSHTEGWQSCPDRRDDAYIYHHWRADWSHPDYGIASVWLEYHVPADQQQLTSLHCNIHITSQADYEQQRKASEKLERVYSIKSGEVYETED